MADVLLIDFGGVLTSSVFEGWERFCEAEGLPASRMLDVYRGDAEAGRLLNAIEEGRLGDAEFCRAFAPLLGPGIAHERLIQRMTAALEPDQEMLDAVAALRAAGVTTVLLSNSLGYDVYDGYELEDRFDHIVISGRVGKRKPARRIFRVALEMARSTPARALFVDDFQNNIDAAERLGIESILHERAGDTIPRLEAAFGVAIAA